MTYEELQMLQALPLDIKIEKTKARIREWVRYYGEDNVYISFSGGKDSSVLLHVARQLYPNIKAVFCDTGLEYPEIKKHVRTIDNVEIIRPKYTFKEVIIKYGYPVVSKEVSKYVHDITDGSEHMRNMRLYGQHGDPTRWRLPRKWLYLTEAPFKCSDRCCHYLKKYPFQKYERETHKVGILGTLAEESRYRRSFYLKNGCNAFEASKPHSTPIAFWRERDILEYIDKYNVKIPDCYGEIVVEDGVYKINGKNRTGCIFCTFGVLHEEEPNRFQMLKETHPKLYDYCINGGCYKDGKWIPDSKGLGMGKVLDYINVPY